MRDRINSAARRVPPWTLYWLAVLPVVWLFWQGATGGLGVEPVEKIEHRLGLWGLWLLLAGLSVTPLLRLARINLLRFRRALGLTGFAYILVHLLTWAVLDVQSLARVGADIVKRPYITIGMLALLLLVPLAMTSTDRAIRRLGPQRWRNLHRLVYPAVVLGAVHFVMLRKGWQLEPVLYLAAVLCVLGLRLYRKPVRAARA